METLDIILIVACAVLALIFIIFRATKGGLIGLITKTLASFAFVASSIVALTSNNGIAPALISIGLLLGMIGDILLDLKVIYEGNDKYYLNAGMLSFGLGHICYFIAFTLIASSLGIGLLTPILVSVGVAIVLTIGITLSSKKMNLNFGSYLWQTVAYTFILSFMTIYTLVLAIYGGSWLAFVGLLLFFASDIVLSLQYFGGKISSKPLMIINHALYYAAQIVLLAVLFIL